MKAVSEFLYRMKILKIQVFILEKYNQITKVQIIFYRRAIGMNIFYLILFNQSISLIVCLKLAKSKQLQQ